MLSAEQIAAIAWEKSDGLIPAVVQDVDTLAILMLGYMNAEALAATLNSGKVTFFSRSKQRLWCKGESSGHFLELKDIWLDCDNDTLLIAAKPQGPTCHTGSATCFGEFDHVPSSVARDNAPSANVSRHFLEHLDELIASRKRDLPANSYTTKLFTGELRRIAQKVGEEGVETALAAVAQDERALLGESADLIYHLLVLLHAKGLNLNDVVQTLSERHGKH